MARIRAAIDAGRFAALAAEVESAGADSTVEQGPVP
jgi:hypothetical protein